MNVRNRAVHFIEAVADPEGRGQPPSFLEQTEARWANIFFSRPLPNPLYQGRDDHPPSPQGLDPSLRGAQIREGLTVLVRDPHTSVRLIFPSS